MATWNHPWWVRIVVDLNLWEKSNILSGETETNVSAGIARATVDTPPVLDLRHDDIDTLAQKVIHVLALQFGSDTKVLASANAETSNGFPRLV